ncbi:unnamed protein product [Rangifer tarandus platyrhynchus]|uniref:Uncharacterized protein n=1 Tax=Rangifer tarandus platyrhynchus TaxID=3082113 RepID=A0ABN8ZI31_RANTA|nr:unnamed protein product [Rangifer tarandus platyrhynchus]
MQFSDISGALGRSLHGLPPPDAGAAGLDSFEDGCPHALRADLPQRVGGPGCQEPVPPSCPGADLPGSRCYRRLLACPSSSLPILPDEPSSPALGLTSFCKVCCAWFSVWLHTNLSIGHTRPRDPPSPRSLGDTVGRC